MSKIQYSGKCEKLLEKKVGSFNANYSHVYLPKSWEGKRIIILLEPE